MASNSEGSESNSSKQPDITSDRNKPGQMYDTVTSSSHQLVPGYRPSGIGKSDPNQVIRVKSSKMYSVNVKGDSETCWILGICATATGEFIITDRGNNKVKLLDQTYKVVAQCNLSDVPNCMCSIDFSLVAVALKNNSVHFIRVTNGRLVHDRRLKLQHTCNGIAHHQDNLYIASDTALYQYSVDGRLVSKMYEDLSGFSTVSTCAVSPDGDRIYVLNLTSGQLMTLSRDGKVLSNLQLYNLTDGLKLKAKIVFAVGRIIPSCIHVTDSEQVLVCESIANTIIQVDKDERHRLVEVISGENLRHPTTIYYNKHSGTLIVGICDNNNILVSATQ
ncbi:uncharacterized protein LOC127859528 [Dreissena polymorpha]|uniref:Uncharacterized protein n=1 Tax=Dreissena polymorpha TaxID=45954 RepID=A0A9D4BQS2_DREPO|nr:uncharacterized protein LOC127859528 [Dreissena polymorpha]KAH3703998.1 hypothetical protein DPMN_079053 [Dreissena polymorpha]